MKLNTYDHTPRPERNKPISAWVIIAAAFLYEIVGLLAFGYFRGSQWPLGILIILDAILVTVMLLGAKKDIEESYVEILGDNIHIVDYPFGIKREKQFKFSDITSAEICHAYSSKTKGCHFSTAADHFIVFFSGKKYLFKIICLPETKEIFSQFIQ